MQRSEKYKKMTAGKEVDLVPFMNLIAILIPILMVSMQYIKIASIPVGAPSGHAVINSGEPPDLSLTILAGKRGFYLFTGDEEGKKGGIEPDLGKTHVQVYYASDNEKGREKEVLRIWRYKDRRYLLGVSIVEDEDLDLRLSALKGRYGALRSSDEMDYDYPALQERLREIKGRHQDEKKVLLTADPQVEYMTLVRMMDASREFKDETGEVIPLFPQVTLGGGVS